MNRIKTLLIFVFVIALSFSLVGCKLLPWGDSAAEDTAAIDALPGWLTLAHRAEAAEEPETEEEAAEAPTQAAAAQPAATQPEQAEQPAQTGTPRWQQPGTMEYIAKMQLDEMVSEYNRLKNNRYDDNFSAADKSRLDTLSRDIPEVAKGLGIDLKQHYGIDVAGADSSMSSGNWFHNMDSPSGWGD